MKKAVGYIRVSTKGQADKGESLPVQKEKIEAYCKMQEWELTKIYADEGISGKSVEKRKGLTNLLNDAHDKEFEVAVINRLTRFGRNTTDTLQNAAKLREQNIKLVSLAENMDFDTATGKLLLTFLAAFAEWENQMRAEQIMDSRMKRAAEGKFTGGRLPVGRKWDKETKTFKLDEKFAGYIRWAAQEYLSGESLKKVSKELKACGLKGSVGYTSLLQILAERCGDKWEVKLNGDKIVYPIPRILDQDTIERIRGKIAQNRTFTRASCPNHSRYALAGFFHCNKCGFSLTGQTQNEKYKYYRHPWDGGCKKRGDDNKGSVGRQKTDGFSKIRADVAEDAVLELVFDNASNEAAYHASIQRVFPTKEKIREISDRLELKEKNLASVNGDLEKLVDSLLDGTLTKETIKKREAELYETKEELERTIEKDRRELEKWPKIETILKVAEDNRQRLMEKYGSKDRIKEMSFNERRDLFEWLFPTELDEHEERYGVFIQQHSDKIYDIRVNALLFERGDLIHPDGQRVTHPTEVYKSNIDFKTILKRPLL